MARFDIIYNEGGLSGAMFGRMLRLDKIRMMNVKLAYPQDISSNIGMTELSLRFHRSPGAVTFSHSTGREITLFFGNGVKHRLTILRNDGTFREGIDYMIRIKTADGSESTKPLPERSVHLVMSDPSDLLFVAKAVSGKPVHYAFALSNLGGDRFKVECLGDESVIVDIFSRDVIKFKKDSAAERAKENFKVLEYLIKSEVYLEFIEEHTRGRSVMRGFGNYELMFPHTIFKAYVAAEGKILLPDEVETKQRPEHYAVYIGIMEDDSLSFMGASISLPEGIYDIFERSLSYFNTYYFNRQN